MNSKAGFYLQIQLSLYKVSFGLDYETCSLKRTRKDVSIKITLIINYIVKTCTSIHSPTTSFNFIVIQNEVIIIDYDYYLITIL